MTPSELPDDLSGASNEELAKWAEGLRAAAEKLKDRAAEDEAALAELEALAEAYNRIAEEQAARESQAQERAGRAASAADALGLGGDEEQAAEDGAADEDEPMASDDTDAEELAAEPAPEEPVVEAAAAPADRAATHPTEDGEVTASVEEAPAAEAEPVAEAATEDGTTPEGEEPAADAKPAVEAASDDDDTVEAATDEVAAPDQISEAAAADPEPPAPEAEATTPAVEATTTEPSPDGDPAQEAEMPTPTSDPVAAMSAALPGDLAVSGSDGRDRRTVQFTTTAAMGRDMSDHVVEGGVSELAQLVARKHEQLRRKQVKSTVGYEPIVLASAQTVFGDTQLLGADIEHNLAVMRRIGREAEALVASGGNCAPLAPRYDVFSVAEPQSPVETFLPVVGAPRGGVRYVQGPDWTDARAGVRVTTEAEDAAGYTNQTPAGTTEPKPCVHLDCADVVECEVDAVSRCVTFGNLTYRTFPELVEVFLDHLAVAFAEEKEQHYLTAIDTGSTEVNFTGDYGATRSAFNGIALAVTAYRKRNNMSANAPLQVLAPDVLAPFIKTDMVNDNGMGLGFLGANAEQVSNELFRSLNATVGWYYYGADDLGTDQMLLDAQAAGVALNPWPNAFRIYIFAPGTWGRLDGGQLDVGIVRDSSLNSTNDLQLFAEQWIQACKFGNESIRLDLTLCNNGTAPEYVTPFDCATGS